MPVAPPAAVPGAPVKPQYQQLELFDITRPIGQQPYPSATPVSVPGKTPPTPGSPVIFPGTFSHFIPVIRVYSNEFIYSAGEDLDAYFESLDGSPTYVTLTSDVALELSGGKIPVPGAEPYGYSDEGVALYRVVDLGFNPQTGRRERADAGALQGAPEQTGTYGNAKTGRRAEVLDYDPTLKMAYIAVPLNYEGQDVRLHPHLMKGWVDYSDIRPASNNPWRPVDRKLD